MNQDRVEVRIALTSPEARLRHDQAQELASYVRRRVPQVATRLEKDSSNTMDLGATVVLVLGTPFLVAVGKGIGDWLRRDPTAEVTISRDGISAVKVSGRDAVRLTEIFAEMLPPSQDA